MINVLEQYAEGILDDFEQGIATKEETFKKLGDYTDFVSLHTENIQKANIKTLEARITKLKEEANDLLVQNLNMEQKIKELNKINLLLKGMILLLATRKKD